MHVREARFRRVDAVVGGGMTLLLASVAHAEPGGHIHLGNSTEIAPSLQVAGEYHSNPYLTEDSEQDPATPGGALAVAPSVVVSVDTPDLALQFAGGLIIRKYFAEALTPLDRYSDYSLTLNADVLPQSKIGVHVDEKLVNRSRAIEVDEETADEPADLNLVHLSNLTRVQLAIHPGGALSVDVGGHFSSDTYKTPEDADTDFLDRKNGRLGYGPDLDADWRFFPRTAVVLDAYADFFDWQRNILDFGSGNYLSKPDGMELHTLLGVRGQLTDKVVVGVLAGYGQISNDTSSVTDFTSAGPIDAATLAGLVADAELDLSGFPGGLLVTVEGAWSPAENHTLTLGFRRDFDDVSFTNYVAYNNVIGRYQGLLADRFSVLGEVLLRLESYEGAVVRDDSFFRGRLDLAFRTTSFLDLGAGVVYSTRKNTEGGYSDVDYKDVTATFGATFTY